MVQLYGGAASADISTTTSQTLVDVSRIRQVPDTQEVFIIEENTGDAAGAKWDRSVIFDLLERVDAADYAGAIREHLEDIAAGATNHFVETVTTPTGADAHLSYISEANPRRDRHETGSPAAVVTFVGLIRLEKVATDVVVTMNVPVGNDYQVEGAAGTSEYAAFKHICGSYTIHDWGLFGI